MHGKHLYNVFNKIVIVENLWKLGMICGLRYELGAVVWGIIQICCNKYLFLFIIQFDEMKSLFSEVL